MSYLGSTPTTQSFISGTDSFNGTGSATNFTLSRFVNSVNDVQVVVNNVVQYPPNYSVSGNTLTISPAPSSGTNNVYVRYLSTTLQSVAPVPGSTQQFASGTAANPSITFLNDTNTGIYSPAADTIAFAEGGTEAMRVDSSANVGIGTSSPSAKLAVTASSGTIGNFESTQSATNANQLNLNSTQTNSSAGIRFQVNSGTTAQARIQVNGDSSIVFQQTSSDTERARIDSSGNVGINNTSPAQYATSGKVVNITGTANNSGPANLFMPGSSTQTGAGYASTEVFAVSSITSATEITRVTGTNTNGFRAYFKVIVTGHTGGVGNGINIKEYFWDGGTGGATQISTYTNGQVPGITITNSTNYVLIINLSSSNGVNGFNGVMKVEWMLPIDFAASTYTIS